MKNPLRMLAVLAAVAIAVPLAADEGMWMPQQIPDLAAKLREMGFQGDPAAFADLTGQPMGAIVSLGGCTASFVSPEGLIATNHHCATGALQYNSTPQKNLLVDGFLAKTREEEVSNGPGARVFVTVSVGEVTEAITGKIDPKLDDRKRYDVIDRRTKERIAACEAGGFRCSVPSFFGGLEYFEIAQLEIQDARLVYAPAVGIGNFGGETDNWRWPRHTGDWSFFRAYVGKDGKPAPFSKDNEPYRPAHWLTVQPAGVREGDLVFVVGYPGRTQRHQTYAEVKETTEWSFPRFVRTSQEQIDILQALGRTDKELQIKAASRLRGLNNYLTNRKGMLEGLVKGGILAKKEQNQRDLAAWIAALPARQKEYGDVLPALDALQAESEKTRERDAAFASLLSSSTLLGQAHTAHLLSVEKAKKNDMDREAEYQERNWTRTREGFERAQRTLDPRIDKALLRWAMGYAAALPADQRIVGLDKLVGLTPGMAQADSEKAIDQYLERLVSGTKMADKDFRLSLLDKTHGRDRGHEGPVRRPRARPRPALPAEPRGAEAAAGCDVAAAAAVHAGAAREGGRPRGSRRELHAARDVRHREGQAGGRRHGVDAVHDAEGHRAEAHGRGRVRRARPRARGDQGAARGEDDAVRPPPARRRAGRLPLDGRHDRRQLRLPHAQRQG